KQTLVTQRLVERLIGNEGMTFRITGNADAVQVRTQISQRREYVGTAVVWPGMTRTVGRHIAADDENLVNTGGGQPGHRILQMPGAGETPCRQMRDGVVAPPRYLFGQRDGGIDASCRRTGHADGRAVRQLLRLARSMPHRHDFVTCRGQCPSQRGGVNSVHGAYPLGMSFFGSQNGFSTTMAPRRPAWVSTSSSVPRSLYSIGTMA